MPNLKSAIKRVRTSERNAIRNSKVTRAIQSAVRKAETAIAGKGGNIPELLNNAFSAMDKGVEQGVIHRNRAARSKSRLALKANGSSA